MALPRITESEPWLEEDEDYPSKKAEIATPFNLTASVTKFAKIIIYGYLFLKLVSRYSILKIFLTSIRKIAIKHKCLASILFFVSITISSTLTKRSKPSR